MIIYTTDFKDVLLLEPNIFEDERGSFKETFNHEFYNKIISANLNNFVQDNESVSKKGVFRGFHWQIWPMQQAKLVRVVKGRIIDIIICLIKNSPDFGKYIAFDLTAENRKQIYVPRGYAHGFIALEDDTIVNYKVDNYWSKVHERCLNYSCVDFSVFNIPELNDIEFIVSEKDKQGINFDDLSETDVFYDNDIKDETVNTEELPESKDVIDVD